MKPIVRVAALALALAVGAGWYHLRDAPQEAVEPEEALTGVSAESDDPVRQAFEQQARGRMLRVAGRVERILADDRDGSPHQRFIIVTNSGQSLLVAHNLDLAPRLDGLAVGDRVTVYGEYEWNPQGGVMHWTHDDPDGSHVAGYIEWQSRKYQ